MTNTRCCYCFGILASSLALAALISAGCGGTKKGQLPTAQVAGQVTHRGQPLPRGTIKFIPVQSGKGVRVAYGALDAQGGYRLSTYGQGDGAILGDFRVVVESREELPPDAGVAKQMTKGGLAPARLPQSLIPERYAKPETSDLTARVEAGSNTINFELKD